MCACEMSINSARAVDIRPSAPGWTSPAAAAAPLVAVQHAPDPARSAASIASGNYNAAHAETLGPLLPALRHGGRGPVHLAAQARAGGARPRADHDHPQTGARLRRRRDARGWAVRVQGERIDAAGAGGRASAAAGAHGRRSAGHDADARPGRRALPRPAARLQRDVVERSGVARRRWRCAWRARRITCARR